MSPSAIPLFDSLRVAVVGDLVADHYLFAAPRRLSREAPVMVLRFERETIGAGGGANVARNLRALGAAVSVFGVVGGDANGRELLRTLENEGLELSGVQRDADWITPTKTRVLAAEPRRFPQQVLRIDREPAAEVSGEVRRLVAEEVARRAAEFDAILLSDYEYGLVGEELGRVASRRSLEGQVVVLDPRRGIERFAGITALTPNIGELARFSGVDPDSLDRLDALRDAARGLLGRVQSRWLLVTRGNLGMALFGEGCPEEGVAVEASGHGEVTDVSGAGDSAAAVFTLALAAGLEAAEAMRLANTASGVVVMVNGAAVCTRKELEAALAASPPAVRLARSSFE